MPTVQPSQSVSITAVRGGTARVRLDEVAVEAPLQIRVRALVDGAISERDVSITMRTPGLDSGADAEDAELAVGFLFTEGTVRGAADVEAVEHPAPELVVVTLHDGSRVDFRSLERGSAVTTSACGVCGKRSIDTLAAVPGTQVGAGPQVSPELVTALPERLRAAQATFERTGGLHAAALFTASGELIALREDVGRHNAVDKLLGARLRAGGLPAHGQILVVSGRASFELVQKARMAAVPIFVAVGAPSSLAVGLAQEAGMTLCGFTRPGSCNVYSGGERLGLAAVAGPAPADNELAEWTKDEQGRQQTEAGSETGAEPPLGARPRRGRSLRILPSG